MKKILPIISITCFVLSFVFMYLSNQNTIRRREPVSWGNRSADNSGGSKNISIGYEPFASCQTTKPKNIVMGFDEVVGHQCLNYVTGTGSKIVGGGGAVARPK